MASEASSVRESQIESFLESLSQEEFSLESIMDGSNLELLITPFDLKKAEEDSQYRFRKYVEKRVLYRGEKFSGEARKNIRDGIRTRRYIDAFLKAVLGHFGILGWMKLYYHSFAYSIVKRLKRPHFTEWPRILQEVYDIWVRSKGLDPKIAKIVALLTAKVYYQLQYGKFKPPDGVSEELYPELEYKYKEALEKKIAQGIAPTPEESEEQSNEGEG